MELDEDEGLFLSAETLLKVHVRRDESVRKEFLYEWERNASIRSIVETKRKKRKKRIFKGDQKRGRVYPLSGVFRADGSLYYVCRNGFTSFFGIGGTKMQTIEKSVEDGKMIPALHGLSSRVGNASMKAEVADSMSAFFERMKLMAEPHASKVVRIETKIVMKDGDDDVELPSNFTKRGMYERWCLDRGWVVKARGGNGSYGRIAKYETRKTQ